MAKQEIAPSLQRKKNGDRIDANSTEISVAPSILVPVTVLETERRLIVSRLHELNRLLGYSPPHAGHKNR